MNRQIKHSREEKQCGKKLGEVILDRKIKEILSEE